jgi:hypothetical protein
MLVLRSVRGALPDRRRHGEHAVPHTLNQTISQNIS